MSKIPYEKEQLQAWCQDSYSYNEVLVKSGRVKGGRNVEILKKYIQLYSIDISHFTSLTNPKKEKKELPLQKKCCQCGEIKDTFNDYYWSNGKTRKICKDCVKSNERQKYAERTEKLNDFKKTLSCKKCGETRYYLFEFHHRNPEEKDFQISDHSRAPLEQLIAEIEKCDTLCANCHREWHYLNSHSLCDSYDKWLSET